MFYKSIISYIYLKKKPLEKDSKGFYNACKSKSIIPSWIWFMPEGIGR
ncbi:MAG: hypothetical protein BWX94_01345 [Tenericutes bacterium ADurb.Bin140]|jgi:hypothetical protein|nr:MAG: hypothetical protein BWX94_01345 [Tenericutes bacterium ADurb.Bin140]